MNELHLVEDTNTKQYTCRLVNGLKLSYSGWVVLGTLGGGWMTPFLRRAITQILHMSNLTLDILQKWTVMDLNGACLITGTALISGARSHKEMKVP